MVQHNQTIKKKTLTEHNKNEQIRRKYKKF
jgi:hypothetical protein